MIRRGEIYWVNWSPGRGSEQAGLRPALIIQNDIGNQYSPTTIVAAISTKVPPKAYPFQVLISVAESGLPEDSIVKCEQIMTVDSARLVNRVGQLPDTKMAEVDTAICRSLGLSC
ncbi:MAG: type II toxin-antitoxin system PemK/MazF family toxin [Thermaerobacter sp.]|nr:type II toxin-antitoxin system PemK/MazF family toxin [Thermaerobacter sp.]